jgi:hypothetical protein
MVLHEYRISLECNARKWKILKSRQIKWAAHVARMDELVNARKYRLKLTERKGKSWRPKRRGLWIFSRILKEIGCENVRRMVDLGGSGWGLRRSENSKISHRVPWSRGIFITGWTASRSCRIFLLREVVMLIGVFRHTSCAGVKRESKPRF